MRPSKMLATIVLAGVLAGVPGVSSADSSPPWQPRRNLATASGSTDAMSPARTSTSCASASVSSLGVRAPLRRHLPAKPLHQARASLQEAGAPLARDPDRTLDLRAVSVPVVLRPRLRHACEARTARVDRPLLGCLSRPRTTPRVRRSPGFVRIPASAVTGTSFPIGDGQLSIQYEIFSEPGGGVPAFLARGGQKSAAIDFMKIILARAELPAPELRAVPPTPRHDPACPPGCSDLPRLPRPKRGEATRPARDSGGCGARPRVLREQPLGHELAPDLRGVLRRPPAAHLRRPS